ncbi:hypothetical protein HDU76_013015 [Blyttiomyces sp. JEL0837]|nr:hypothetical protein HDU76_013015 [Blyttiomyces sp. JEL0837]
MTGLMKLDLSNNDLKGEPPSFSQFPSNITINLVGNCLTGNVSLASQRTDCPAEQLRTDSEQTKVSAKVIIGAVVATGVAIGLMLIGVIIFTRRKPPTEQDKMKAAYKNELREFLMAPGGENEVQESSPANPPTSPKLEPVSTHFELMMQTAIEEKHGLQKAFDRQQQQLQQANKILMNSALSEEMLSKIKETDHIDTNVAEFGSSFLWAVEEVCQWLRVCGFDGSIVEKFKEHEISGEIMHNLTVDTLKELGILNLTTRIEIIQHVAALRPGLGADDHDGGDNNINLTETTFDGNGVAPPMYG